ncbi:hypothetical protein LINPERHAP2_LOCUS9735 [Linum perenne]
MLLNTVGKDGNNQMYLIAWTMVEGENRSSWTWFINIIREDWIWPTILDGQLSWTNKR